MQPSLYKKDRSDARLFTFNINSQLAKQAIYIDQDEVTSTQR